MVDYEDQDHEDEGQDDERGFISFVKTLEEHNIASLEWTIWYDSDEYQFNDDPIMRNDKGEQIPIITSESDGKPGSYKTTVHPAFKAFNGEGSSYRESWREYLWDISDKFDKAGVFKLNIKERTVQQIADAYIPETDVQVDPIDPVELKFTLDGNWDGPFHPTWSKKDKDSPYRLQIWVDPKVFVPRNIWGAPYARQGGGKLDPNKVGWMNWEEFGTVKEAIDHANVFHQTGEDWGQYKYPEPGQPLIKGKTSARVLDAWDNELYVINTKGIAKDRRGPFRIQIQDYRRLVELDPWNKDWRDLVEGSPNHHKFPPLQRTYHTVAEAYRDAKEYVSMNGGKEFKYLVRIVDSSDRQIEMVYKYKAIDYTLLNRDVSTYYISSKEIPANGILLELHADDLYQLAEQLRVKQQHEWANQHARDFYGDDAYMVRVSVVSEYNDQGYDDVVEDIEVSDINGNVLSYDVNKIKTYIEDDLDRQVRNYIQYGNGDNDIVLLPNSNKKVFMSNIDDNLDMIDYSHYDVTKNEDFYEYIKDEGMDDYLYEIKNSVDTTGLNGDYVVGEFVPTDPRWSSMRIFTLTTKG